MGLPEILLWLLSFAVLFGILEQVKMPSSKSARALISIAIAFLVIMAAPVSLVTVLSSMSSGLVLVALGLLVLIVFFEVTGIKFGKEIIGKDGKPIEEASTPVKIFEKYGYIFVMAFALIAILIFVNSGGLALLGWNINLSSASNITVVFLSMIIIAVLWMVKE